MMTLLAQPERRLHPAPKLGRFPSHRSRALPLHARTRGVSYNARVLCVSREAASNPKRIPWSDVVEKQSARRVFSWYRKWSSVDLARVAVAVLLHLLSLFAPFTFSWAALWTAITIYTIGGIGISLSYHRNLTHRSFTLPKWLEYTFAYWGVMANQWDPIDWVSTHRCHHRHTDTSRDPHSPTQGFWYSYFIWLFDTESTNQKRGGSSNVADLVKQPFYRFLQRTYLAHPAALMLLLYALGGFPYAVWGMGVSFCVGFHTTMLVNSVCHSWGRRPWNTPDQSRNNWWVALLSFGEGWHNNHHAFQHSARLGLEWWEVDMVWYVVLLLQALGLATDVKLPSEFQKQKMSFAPEGGGRDSTTPTT